MKQQLSDYYVDLGVVLIRCDNISAINRTKNLIIHFMAKHNRVRHQFIREHVEKGECILNFFVLV